MDFVEDVENMLSVFKEASQEDVASLEKIAIRLPETREEIVAALNNYAHRCNGTRSARAAKHAVKRLGVITMLEILSAQEQG